MELRDVQRLVRGAAGRLRGMVRRATLGSLDTSGAGQTLRAGTTHGDEDEGVELFEPYGFTSAPPPGSEGIVLRVGAERAGAVGLCFGARTVRLAGVGPSEVAMYDDAGASVVLRQSGAIEVTPSTGGTVLLGGPLAVEPVALGTALVAALSTFATSIGARTTTLNTAAQVYFAVPLPTPAQQTAYLTALADYQGAIAAAVTLLSTQLGQSLSTEIFTT